MHQKDNSTTPADDQDSLSLHIFVTIFAAIVVFSALVWLFGIGLILKGIGGLLLIALIATGVGAVVVGVVLVVTGSPVVSILPLLWLGIKTFAVVLGVGLLLLGLFSILGPGGEKIETGETD